MIYLRELEAQLEKCGLKINIFFLEGRQIVKKVIPRQRYADDRVLISNDMANLLEQLNICSKKCNKLE